MTQPKDPLVAESEAAICQECGHALNRHMRIDGKLHHPSQTASFRYDLLAPEFRPGGMRDPKWMEGVRRMLADAKSVEPSIVESLFHYYDAAKNARFEASLSSPHGLREALLGATAIIARFVKSLTRDGQNHDRMLHIDHDELSAILKDAKAALYGPASTPPQDEMGWQPIETAKMWGLYVVTDRLNVALAQKAESDFDSCYWAIEPEDQLDWEPTHCIEMPAAITSQGGEHGKSDWDKLRWDKLRDRCNLTNREGGE